MTRINDKMTAIVTDIYNVYCINEWNTLLKRRTIPLEILIYVIKCTTITTEIVAIVFNKVTKISTICILS